MKGKIDEDGNLYIERAGKMKQQFCPFDVKPCGDWCPLFGEPEAEFGTKSVILHICKDKMLFLDEFTDERDE